VRRLALRVRLRVRAYAARGAVDLRLGGGVRVGRHVRLMVGRETHSSLQVRDGARIEDGASLQLRGGTIVLGPRTVMGESVFVDLAGGSIELGSEVELRPGVVLRSEAGEIVIGEGTSVGDQVVVVGGPGAPVRVGRGAELGVKVTLLPGADVLAGAVVPPNAVVSDRFTPASRRGGARRPPRSRRRARPSS
jgi:carbonic anhydrase/acetyltransferase-like protein (isoleucine patch superfamily)